MSVHPLDLVGGAAAAGAASMWLPQAARAVRVRRRDPGALAGISLATYAVAVLFNALLLVYGLAEHAVPVVVAGAVNLLCAGVIVAVVLPARTTGRAGAR
ncbi:MAG: hypothetical protein CMH83_14625 [Nocardioides sp.]|nr:hypothetical protein [Nocardioides sp.]